MAKRVWPTGPGTVRLAATVAATGVAGKARRAVALARHGRRRLAARRIVLGNMGVEEGAHAFCRADGGHASQQPSDLAPGIEQAGHLFRRQAVDTRVLVRFALAEGRWRRGIGGHPCGHAESHRKHPMQRRAARRQPGMHVRLGNHVRWLPIPSDIRATTLRWRHFAGRSRRAGPSSSWRNRSRARWACDWLRTRRRGSNREAASRSAPHGGRHRASAAATRRRGGSASGGGLC